MTMAGIRTRWSWGGRDRPRQCALAEQGEVVVADDAAIEAPEAAGSGGWSGLALLAKASQPTWVPPLSLTALIVLWLGGAKPWLVAGACVPIAVGYSVNDFYSSGAQK